VSEQMRARWEKGAFSPLRFMGEGPGEGGLGACPRQRENSERLVHPLPPFGHPLPEGEGHQMAASSRFYRVTTTGAVSFSNRLACALRGFWLPVGCRRW